MTVAPEERGNVTPRPSGPYRRAVGVFDNREATEKAIRALKEADFDMQRVSLIARNVEEVEGSEEVKDQQQGNEAKEGAGAGATAGTVLGGIGGFLVGVGALAIPGVGPILAAGAEISAVASTLAGAGIGAAGGGLIGALVGMGIPEERAKVYQNRIKAGDYLLMVSGTEEQIRRAEPILRDQGIQEFGIYDAPDLNREAPTEAVERREVVEQPRTEVTREQVVEEGRRPRTEGEPDVIIRDERHQTR